jgi:hypothetical protein
MPTSLSFAGLMDRIAGNLRANMGCAVREVQASWAHTMGWLDKLLNKGTEGTPKEKPEENSELIESDEVESLEPVATASEGIEEASSHISPEEEKGPPPREDPFLKALERHGGDMVWALKEVCRRIEFNEDAEVRLAFVKYSYKISDEGFERLSEMESLEILDVTDTAITDVGMKHLSTLPKLLDLIVDVTEVGDNGLAFLAEKHALRRLSLAATKVSDVGLKHLENLKQLESLSLSGTNITQRGLIHLQGLTNLKFLDLSENEIRDNGLQYLHDMSKLEFISLNDTRVSDQGIKHLNAFGELRFFNVKRTFVTEEQIALLIECMPDCKFNMD